MALDASTLEDRWTVLSISVLVRGCAIPVAWKVIGAHAKGSWRPYWEELSERLKGSVPADWQVLVLADRGLYTRWLYTAILACGWHPFLRSAPYHAVRHLPRSGIELGGGSRVIQPT